MILVGGQNGELVRIDCKVIIVMIEWKLYGLVENGCFSSRLVV